MSRNAETSFEAFLQQHNDAAWARVIADLLPSIHEVDRNATQIWFAFFPLKLARALAQAKDPAQLAKQLQLEGTYLLKDQIDSSHKFLYGHRYWPAVKKAVLDAAAGLSETSVAGKTSHSLATQIGSIAAAAAAHANTKDSLLIGITAVAVMSVQQVGLAAFADSPGAVHLEPRNAKRSPEQVLSARARDDGQGLLGFLKTDNKVWTVTFDETKAGRTFKLIHKQDLAGAAAGDTRDYRSLDPRCTEGPIPVQCRSAACGSCWVGVLGGAEKLAPVATREGKRIKEFGYIDTPEATPLIRLACQAASTGAVSIVIPPWNGFLGKHLHEQQQQQHLDSPDRVDSEIHNLAAPPQIAHQA